MPKALGDAGHEKEYGLCHNLTTVLHPMVAALGPRGLIIS